MNSLSWVEIKTENIQHNIQQVRKILPAGFKVAGVVKSNAYGHGLLGVANYLYKNKLVDYLAVVNDEEALFLRKQEIKLPIFVLSYWDICNLIELVKNNIEFGIYNEEHLVALKGLKSSHKAKVHLKIDTGMTRLGLRSGEVTAYLTKLMAINNVEVRGVFSHLAVADEENNFTEKQIATFCKITGKIQEKVKVPLVHIANSAGAIFVKDGLCNMMRLGVGSLWLSAC